MKKSFLAWFLFGIGNICIAQPVAEFIAQENLKTVIAYAEGDELSFPVIDLNNKKPSQAI